MRLNSLIALLFVIGSALFVLGSIPPYIHWVGASTDAMTYFVGSIFFTVASLGQLLQAQTPAMSAADERSQHVAAPVRWLVWRPGDKGWVAAATQFPGTLLFNFSTGHALAHNLTVAEENKQIWQPDLYGSILFLVASTYALAALGRIVRWQPDSWAWRVGWVNMAGSVLFMASALASYVLPSTGDLISSPVSIAGTGLGAACFLVGAAWMLPEWRQNLQVSESA